MDFAKNLLNKFGWQDGEGLGKDKQGITQPIKANLKFDQAGLGSDAASEFNNNWWERIFNEASDNVHVHEKNGNISVDLKDKQNSVEVSTKSYSVKKLAESGNGVYSNNFLTAEAASSGSFAVTKYKILSDDELFKACGGRTAHKGARHGLKLSGKLARLEQQEKELLAKMQTSKNSMDKVNKIEEPLKKEKEKSKKESYTNKEKETKSLECLKNEACQEDNLDLKKIKKKSKKEYQQIESLEIQQNEDCQEDDTGKRKQKKHKEMTPSNEEEFIENLLSKKAKKKKRKNEITDTPEEEEVTSARKNKKSKSDKS